jgi:hypothetical protein
VWLKTAPSSEDLRLTPQQLLITRRWARRPIAELLEDTFVPMQGITAFNGQCDYLGDAGAAKADRGRDHGDRPRPTCVGPSCAGPQRVMMVRAERPSLSPHPVSQPHRHVRRTVLTQWSH